MSSPHLSDATPGSAESSRMKAIAGATRLSGEFDMSFEVSADNYRQMLRRAVSFPDRLTLERR